MPYLKTNAEALLRRSKRYVYRIFLMRQVGTTLSFILISPVLLFLNYDYLAFILLGINAFIWPSVAYLYAKNQKDGLKSTNISLIIDAALGAAWIAAMQVSPFPSLILVAILISDRYAVGGWRILKPTIIAMVSVFLIVWGLLGFHFNIHFNEQIVWFSLPLATICIMTLSALTHSLAVELIYKNREFERIALMDPRLHIPNRRLFEQRLASTFLQSERNLSKAHLIMLDVDHFKYINDTYGHEAGDYFLAEMSVVLKQSIEPKDTPARFGGDELAVIVLDRSDEEIVHLAQEIKNAIQCIHLQSDPHFSTTVSIGIASTEAVSTVSEWFALADSALYQVKRNGRDGIQLN